MFPEEFIKRLKSQDYIDGESLLVYLEQPPPVSIRINRAKWNLEPSRAKPVPWCNSGWYIDKRPSFTSDPLFHSGCYYPQEASGMFLEQVFNQLVPKTGFIRALDLCGAPGGKSTHLSSLIGDRGFLVANEVIRQRAGILSENIVKWGIGNTVVTNNDPDAFNRLPGYFDLILVDAPCSGEGMFSDHAARSEWSSGNASLCSERQRRILIDVWSSLNENGILIYSTCTFNPAENEENIKWLSEKTGAAPVRLNISGFEGVQEISYKGISGYGFYPGKIIGEGLFISVVRKTSSTTGTTRHSKSKDRDQVTSGDRKIAKTLLTISPKNLYRHGDVIYNLSLPVEEFHFLRDNFKIIRGGTAIIKIRREDFTPLHDLALYPCLNEDAFTSSELDLQQAILFLRKENFLLDNCSRGWLLLKYRGVNIGFGKNIGSRVNNYYPSEWRIRMEGAGLLEKVPVSWQPATEKIDIESNSNITGLF